MSDDETRKVSYLDLKNIRSSDLIHIVREIVNDCLHWILLVRFRIHPDYGKPYDAAIDPGPVPPTFVHSWALDIHNLQSFFLAAGKDGLDLNWESGDHVVLYVPETGQTVMFCSEQEIRTQPVELRPPPPAFPVRVYIILRISDKRWISDTKKRHRRFRLVGVNKVDIVGEPRAVLIGDNLNYDTRYAPNRDPWFDDGTRRPPYQGWIQGPNTLSGAEVDEPKSQDGWHLLARFTPPPGQSADFPVYTLVYYNEQVSRLRLYLLPGVRLDGATGLEVRLRLLGRAPGTTADYVKLEGAFFDDDSRPHTWSEALLIVPTLTSNKWTMVETSMLYPMAKELPSGEDTSGKGLFTNDPKFPPWEDWFKPVYDSTFDGGDSWMGNIRLQVELTPFERGTAKLDFIGEGVGQAIQEYNSTGDSFLKLLTDSVTSAVKTGKEAYEAGEWIYNKVKKAHKKNHPNLPFSGLLGLGPGAFSGAVGAVAAGIAFFDKVFSNPKRLQLALELKIRGSITGSIYTPLAKKVFDCYLPGRFDARAMHISEGVPLTSPTLHELLPRYDRPLGHLGYRYDPTRLKCRSIYFGPYGDVDIPSRTAYNGSIYYAWSWGMRCVWPAPRNPVFPYKDFEEYRKNRWGLESSNHPAPIDGFLPVFVNECAEIRVIPINPTDSKRTELPDAPKGPRQPTHHHVGNVAFGRHVKPEPGDTGFPAQSEELGAVGGRSIWVFHDGDWEPTGAWDGTIEDRAGWDLDYIERGKGYWLDCGPGGWVPPLRDFSHHSYIRTQDFGQISLYCFDEDHENANPSVDSQIFLDKQMDRRHFRPFEPGKPWPLADIIFAWDIRYLYYGRSRKEPGGRVPRRKVHRKMRSPVTISITRFDCDYGMKDFSWGNTGGDAPSNMMLEEPW